MQDYQEERFCYDYLQEEPEAQAKTGIKTEELNG